MSDLEDFIAQAQSSSETAVGEVYFDSHDAANVFWFKHPQDGGLLYAAPQAQVVNQQMLELLKMALVDLEAYEIQIEGEFGQCRTLEQLEADGFLPESIIKIRAAIAAAQGIGK